MTVLVPCRNAEESEVPTGASRLAKHADAAGWRRRTTYAKAELDEKVIESVVVHLRRPPLAAVAAWHNGKFTLAYVGSPYTPPRKIGARDLTKFIKETNA